MKRLRCPRLNFVFILYEVMGCSRVNFIFSLYEATSWLEARGARFNLSLFSLFSLSSPGTKTLSSKVQTYQKQIATNSVEHTLDTVRQLANRPRPLIDNLALLAALERTFRCGEGNLACGEEKVRYHFPPMQAEVATQIQKLLKSGTAQVSSFRSPLYSPYVPPSNRYSRPLLESLREHFSAKSLFLVAQLDNSPATARDVLFRIMPCFYILD